MTPPAPERDPILMQADTALEIAREARLAGDVVTEIAAITLAAQLVQVARNLSPITQAKP